MSKIPIYQASNNQSIGLNAYMRSMGADNNMLSMYRILRAIIVSVIIFVSSYYLSNLFFDIDNKLHQVIHLSMMIASLIIGLIIPQNGFFFNFCGG